MLRNIKTQRYKTKAEFAADLDLIWENCLFFNTLEVSDDNLTREHLAISAETTLTD